MMPQLSRRKWIRSTLAPSAGAILLPHLHAQDFNTSRRYPDSAVKAIDPQFSKYMVFNAGVERIATGMRWAEGPVWFGDMRCLLWSDIPTDRIMKWDEETGVVSLFRAPSNQSNGNSRDREGRLLTCEHLTRRVTRTEHDGSIKILLDRYDHKKLNSPNDVVAKSDGSIWFTDPSFGISNNYEGEAATPELPTQVYRIDGKTGKASAVISDIKMPNGLCFSPDESKLYVTENGVTPNVIHVYDIGEDGQHLTNKRKFLDAGKGGTDGIRCDVDGNLWCGWGGGEGLDGVRIYSSQGKPIGSIELPERCANLCFGGKRHNRLFMASSRSIYSVYVNTKGATIG